MAYLIRELLSQLQEINRSFDDLRACDLEIVINADGRKESWIVTLDKRSLVSLNPQIDLSKHITM